KEKRPLIVLTTVNALIQRAPPRSLFEGRVLTLGTGGRIPLDRLQGFLRNNGYFRTDTVREPGEFAVRGGIVDLYPAGAAQPIRLDFFGDQIESLRSFDPLSQRSTGTLESFALRPVSEVLLDEPAIHLFRTRYRELFGAGSDDPLYESVSVGRRQAGMEHWLPLYYERLESLFDYLPGATLSFDHQADEVRAHRTEAIADFYAARKSLAGSAANAAAPVYRPVPPDRLYLDEAAWGRALAGRSTVQLSPFAGDESAGAIDAGARPAKSFAAERADAKVQLFDAVRDYLGGERTAGRRTAIAAFSAGSADRLGTVLRERGLADLTRVGDARALARLPKSATGLAILPLEQGFATEDLLFLGEQDILGDRLARVPRRRRNVEEFITEAASLSPGDLVVHAENARQARRGRLAGAQGPGQAAHSRDRQRADPHRCRAPVASRRDDGPAR